MDLFMNYDEILCRRIQEVKPSGIRRFFDILEEMKDAISLGVGEPDFVTPWHIRDAGIYSLEKGFTKYTSNAGMAELRRGLPEPPLRPAIRLRPSDCGHSGRQRGHRPGPAVHPQPRR